MQNNQNHRDLAKTYSPSDFEDRIYKLWEDSGSFKPSGEGEAFTIVIPPPNVTGQLHIGHALDGTWQDILIRYKRMAGFDTLWVPGTDHAGIATQIKVEEALRVERGLSRHDLGREEFTSLVWDWRDKYGGKIIEQLKKIGASCDWSRLRFTMDEQLSRAVLRVFVSLYKKGLIYRGLRITSLCPCCATALSDAEVNHEDAEGSLWYIKYPVKNAPGTFVTIATTRPETMLGDTAVAVSPADARYTHLIGKTLILPLVGREIPLIADDAVDPAFGTGCVKITPAHDPNDFETGERHGLEKLIIMDNSGKINESGGVYAGLDRYEARKRILADLTAAGLLEKTERHTHSVGQCYRCGTVIEPIASLQWFVSMKPLAAPAIEAVRDGTINFVPARFAKIYLNWMENIRDWCVSRQLWWGHRIPAWHCADCGAVTVAEDTPDACCECGSGAIEQDPDVLDTWFSSALWPFTTLGWPDDTADLAGYYPTSVLVTGYDIITFWVSKMIFMGLEFMDREPFGDVLIHGLVRDAQGRKMSKSSGNGIDPLEIIDKFGADALRFALVWGNSSGNDMRLSEEKVISARNFANKLWNAARFTLMNLEGFSGDNSKITDYALELPDKWIISSFNRLCGETAASLDKYEIGVALSLLYDFTWDCFCDWYIELIKNRLRDDASPQSKQAARAALAFVLDGLLGLLHPFMPFITEEIHASVPGSSGCVMTSDYPAPRADLAFPAEEERMADVIAAIRAVRTRRAEMNIPPKRQSKIYIVTEKTQSFNAETAVYIKQLASASEVIFTGEYDSEEAAAAVTDAARLYMPLSDIIDTAAETTRLNNERAKTLAEISRLENKLANPAFINRAPAAVVNGEKSKLSKYRDALAGLDEALGRLN